MPFRGIYHRQGGVQNRGGGRHPHGRRQTVAVKNTARQQARQGKNQKIRKAPAVAGTQGWGAVCEAAGRRHLWRVNPQHMLTPGPTLQCMLTPASRVNPQHMLTPGPTLQCMLTPASRGGGRSGRRLSVCGSAARRKGGEVRREGGKAGKIRVISLYKLIRQDCF